MSHQKVRLRLSETQREFLLQGNRKETEQRNTWNYFSVDRHTGYILEIGGNIHRTFSFLSEAPCFGSKTLSVGD